MGCTERELSTPFSPDKYYAVSGERWERVRLAVLELYAEGMCRPDSADAQRDMAQRLEWVIFDATEVDPNEVNPK
jgi:hypothetical protein